MRRRTRKALEELYGTDADVLHKAGIVTTPQLRWAAVDSHWMIRYVEIEEYLDLQGTGRNINRPRIQLTIKTYMPVPQCYRDRIIRRVRERIDGRTPLHVNIYIQ